eukprot:12327321-Alexandrium_andersonii.AAC.1
MRMMERAACSASKWRSSSQLLRTWRSCSQAAVAVGGKSEWRMGGDEGRGAAPAAPSCRSSEAGCCVAPTTFPCS